MSETLAASYIRTSNVNAATAMQADDSRARQALAIDAYAERAGLRIEAAFIDASVKGSDPVSSRSGFAALVEWCEANGVYTILVENAGRFSRDLIQQEVGHRMLRDRGFTLIAVDSPETFVADGPTADLVRKILGAVAEFERAGLTEKLIGAKRRASAALGDKCAGRGRVYATGKPLMIARAKVLAAQGATLRSIGSVLAAEGHMTAGNKAFGPSQVTRLLSYTVATAA